MMLVLLLVAVASILGVSYITSATIKLLGSENLVRTARAQYLSESGLDHALYVLRTTPDTLTGSSANPLGPFHVDATGDYYEFSAVNDAYDPERYYLTAQARVGALTRTSSCVVYRGVQLRNDIIHGMIIGGAGASLPIGLTINGDLHNNGSFLFNNAHIYGDVGSVGAVWDPFGWIDGTVTEGLALVDMPDVQLSHYQAYSHNGLSSTAMRLTTDEFLGIDPLNNGGIVLPGNSGGVLWLTPASGTNVYLTGAINFNGTIIIDGSVTLTKDAQISITPVKGFPAIVATGNLYVEKKSQALIDGLVVLAGGVFGASGQGKDSTTTINGGLISGFSGYDANLKGTHELNFVRDKCAIYDFRGQESGGQPDARIQILSYE